MPYTASRLDLAPLERRLERAPLGFIAVAGALTLTLFRLSPVESVLGSHALLLAKSLLHPALNLDPWVRAGWEGPYTIGPRLVAYPLFWMSHGTGWPVERIASWLQLMLWVAQAAIYFRMAQAATGRRDAAFLATLFFGLNLPFTFGDGAYTMPEFDRSLGLVPLLAGIAALLEGRLWFAWVGVVVATYFHPNPAIYLWPLLALVELKKSLEDPSSRPGVLLRVATASVAALPMIVAATGKPSVSWFQDYMHIDILDSAYWIGGFGTHVTHYVFLVQGVALAVMAAQKARAMPRWTLLALGASVSAVVSGLGTIAYVYHPGDSGPWGILIRYEPWVGQYLLELAAQLWMAFWVSERIRSADLFWPVFLLALAFAETEDVVIHMVAIGLAAAWYRRSAPAAIAVVLFAGGLPLLFRFFPHVFHSLGHHAGLRGGLFELPAFDPITGVAIGVCAALGWGLGRASRSLRQDIRIPLAAALMIVMWAGWQQGNGLTQAPIQRLPEWVRDHTRPEAVILMSPLDATDPMAFVSVSERPLFAHAGYVAGPMRYGRAAGMLGERLLELGFDFSRVRRKGDIDPEILRVHRELTPKMAARFRHLYGVGYVLLRTDRAWPGTPVGREGEFALYEVPDDGR